MHPHQPCCCMRNIPRQSSEVELSIQRETNPRRNEASVEVEVLLEPVISVSCRSAVLRAIFLVFASMTMATYVLTEQLMI